MAQFNLTPFTNDSTSPPPRVHSRTPPISPIRPKELKEQEWQKPDIITPDEPLIVTCDFRRAVEAAKTGRTLISIARGTSRGFAGKRYIKLAPERAWLKMSEEDYDENYFNLLDALDPDEIFSELTDDGTRAVAIFCWEEPHVRCHRRYVAEWLEHHLTSHDGTSIVIPELGFERTESPEWLEWD